MRIPDYNDLHNRHQAEQDRQLERLPICCECDEHIQTEECFEFNGEFVCPCCLKENHRKFTFDYVQ